MTLLVLRMLGCELRGALKLEEHDVGKDRSEPCQDGEKRFFLTCLPRRADPDPPRPFPWLCTPPPGGLLSP